MPFLEFEEHDACGIVAWVEKSGKPTFDNILNVLTALDKMKHRAGFVTDEGDGSGIQLDLPRDMWFERLSAAGVEPRHAYAQRFVVAHVVASEAMGVELAGLPERVVELARARGFELLLQVVDPVNRDVLGPGGRAEGVHFYQFALLAPEAPNEDAVENECYELLLSLEDRLGVHVASLSGKTASYKVRGDGQTLREYFDDFRHEGFRSRLTIGHNRYSTNTTTSSERVQPFTLLGHNGELNTIHRLREEMRMLDIPTVSGGSDSHPSAS